MSLTNVPSQCPQSPSEIIPLENVISGDVYSFSIIMQQLILRSPPFKQSLEDFRRSDTVEEQMKTKEVILEIKHGSNPPLRPPVPLSACSQELYQLMERCWEEEPSLRPTFPRIKGYLAKATLNSNSNIVDSLIRTMEQYALTLELQVEEQMRNFMEEKGRSEQILSLILPK
jgi:Protein tyrosine and serine/threonine kinase